MIIKINTKSETPIYLQLRNEIVKGIGKGEFERGRIVANGSSDGYGTWGKYNDRQ